MPRALVALALAVCLPLAAADRFKPFQLKTPEGAVRTFDDVRQGAKAVLVGFFFPSCRFCNAALAEIEAIYGRYKDQGLAAVWINILPEEGRKISGWLARTGSTIPVLTGKSQAALQRDYGVRMTPTHCLVNGEGEVLFRLDGHRKGDGARLEEAIRAALEAAR
jgi:hypothetical protein